jgi:hypothetical protein
MALVSRTALAAIIAFVSPLLSQLGDAQTVAGFKTQSNNIYCMIESPVDNACVSNLRCDIMQMTDRRAPGPKNCPLSWGDAFAIAQNGTIGVRICHGYTTRTMS